MRFGLRSSRRDAPEAQPADRAPDDPSPGVDGPQPSSAGGGGSRALPEPDGALAHGVVLTRDGWPLPAASVTLLATDGTGSARTTSASDGRFALAHLEPGPATLLVACAGHEPLARSVVVQAPGAARPEEVVVDLGELRLARVGAADLPPAGRWVIDPDHTSLAATAHHLGLSAVTGRLSRLEGVVVVAESLRTSTSRICLCLISRPM